MNLISACNQGLFIGGLPAPNNMGVCFSLSIHWLANDCEDVMFQSVATPVNAMATYSPGNTHQLNVLQEAGNWLSGGAIGLPHMIDIAQGLYPSIIQVVPVAANTMTFGNLYAAQNLAPFENNIIWLMDPTAIGNRGHVVAYNSQEGLYFDANSGSFDVEDDLSAEVASQIMHVYLNTYTHFQVFSLQM
ncbi:hypothetical protein [Pseudomonas sp. TE3610]